MCHDEHGEEGKGKWGHTEKDSGRDPARQTQERTGGAEESTRADRTACCPLVTGAQARKVWTDWSVRRCQLSDCSSWGICSSPFSSYPVELDSTSWAKTKIRTGIQGRTKYNLCLMKSPTHNVLNLRGNHILRSYFCVLLQSLNLSSNS